MRRKIKGIRVLVLMACFCFLLSTGVFAQKIYDIRRSLFLRERLAALKSDVERLAVGEIDSKTGDLSSKQQIAENELSEIEKEIELIKAMKGPMAEHYIQVLQKQVEDVRMLFPALAKRAALFQENQISSTTQPASMNLPVPAKPASSAAGLNFASHPSDISGQSQTPKVSVVTVPAGGINVVSPKEVVSSGTNKIAPAKMPPFLQKRKTYFHAIGFRTLLTRQWGHAGPAIASSVTSVTVTPQFGNTTASVATPASVIPVAGITGVPTASSTIITVQDKLPPPVATPPVSITPIQPASGSDPQVRNSPGMRPLAIMIENHSKARPQTGLGEAEVVYEIPVEGGITRFMALYYHVVDLIGPIRSCRDYFIDRALEVNALYVHCGGSPQGYEHIEKTVVLAIDEISNGVPFFRDNSRKAPHNLYSRMPKIIEDVNQRHPMQLPYQRIPLLYGDPPTFSTIPNRGLTIKYHGDYFLTYKFNPQFNVYDRYMNGEQQLDRETLRPVSPGTIILQEAVMKTIDDKGRQDISFIGQGKAYILTGGTILRALWQKAAPREFTKFFDEKGKPVLFSNKSPVWIQVISPENPVAFDPPLPAEVAQQKLETRQN